MRRPDRIQTESSSRQSPSQVAPSTDRFPARPFTGLEAAPAMGSRATRQGRSSGMWAAPGAWTGAAFSPSSLGGRRTHDMARSWGQGACAGRRGSSSPAVAVRDGLGGIVAVGERVIGWVVDQVRDDPEATGCARACSSPPRVRFAGARWQTGRAGREGASPPHTKLEPTGAAS